MIGEICFIAGVMILFFSLSGYLLYLDAEDIERRRARGETIEPPSMWP